MSMDAIAAARRKAREALAQGRYDGAVSRFAELTALGALTPTDFRLELTARSALEQLGDILTRIAEEAELLSEDAALARAAFLQAEPALTSAEAEAMLDWLVACHPNDSAMALSLAEAQLETKGPSHAAETLDAAIARGAADVAVLRARAAIAADQGESALAVSLLRQAIKRSPGAETLWLALIRTQRAAGDLAGAWASLDAALEAARPQRRLLEERRKLAARL